MPENALSPFDKMIQEFLSLGKETQKVSFHLYSAGAQLISSLIIRIRNQEFDWFDRNYHLDTKLFPDQKGFTILSSTISAEMTENDRFFAHCYNKMGIFLWEIDEKWSGFPAPIRRNKGESGRIGDGLTEKRMVPILLLFSLLKKNVFLAWCCLHLEFFGSSLTNTRSHMPVIPFFPFEIPLYEH